MTRTRPRVDRALLGRVQALLARRDAQPLPSGHTRPEVRLTAQSGGAAELLIYDEISWWGVCALDVAAVLSTVTGDLHVRINSPGGDMFDGIAILNLLCDHPGQVTVTVDGVAASAASIIAMAGDTITMNRASQMMIHDASTLCWGNAADMKAVAAMLDMASQTLAEIYAARAGGTAEQWRERMLADSGLGTWYTAQAAVDAGLADATVSPDRDDDEPAPVNLVYERLAAALYPYGARGHEDGRRLAAIVGPAAATPDPGPGQADPQIPAGAPGGLQPDQTQAPATEPPATPTEPASPHSPAGTPEPVPATPTPEPSPASPGTPGEAWDDLVAHLTTSAATATPTAEDLLAHLREAPL